MKALLQDVPRALHHNFIVYYWDIAVWGLYTGSTMTFLGVYAAREGATGAQIGWLSAGPAIVALLASIPAGLLARRIRPKTSVVVSALVARLLLLAYVFVPALAPQADRVNALIALTIVMAIPNTFLNICFGPLMLTAIPAEWRGQVVATRNALMSVISFVVTLVCGQLLVLLTFPSGYQVVFFIGFVGAVATAYVLGQVKVAQPFAQPTSHSNEPWSLQRLLPRRDPAGRHYIVVVMMLFSLNLTGFMGAPLIPKLTVNTLGLNDAVISVGSALASILVFGVSLFVAQLARKHGNKKLTAIGAAMLFLQSFALAFAQDAGLFLAASVVAGCASGILGAASFNYHLDSLPQQDQTAWISWSSMLGNVAVLVGSIVGPALVGVIGMPATFMTLGALRLMIGVMIYVWG